MATSTDLTFDFHLNKSTDQVRNPFPFANRVGDVHKAPAGWVRVKLVHKYWDDAFQASASLNLSAEASMTFSLLDVAESEGKLQQSAFF